MQLGRLPNQSADAFPFMPVFSPMPAWKQFAESGSSVGQTLVLPSAFGGTAVWSFQQNSGHKSLWQKSGFNFI